MEILQIAGIAVSSVVVLSLVRSIKPEMSIYIVLATVITLLLFSLKHLTYVFQFLKSVYDGMTYGKDYFPVLIKVLVIAYLTDFTSQLCIDAGETSIGSKVELAGKIIIFYV